MNPPSPPERPLLRAVEPETVRANGQEILLLHDPMGIAESPWPLTMYGAWLLQFFDGRHTVAEMTEQLRRASGREVSTEEIAGFVAEMDRAGFLVSSEFEGRRERVTREFRESATRPARHTGAYAGDRKKLPGFLRAQWAHERGPGTEPPRRVKKGPVRAILAPHIDFHRGGPCYAHAYGALAGGCDADTFVILGTAHKSPRTLYTATKKAYETPLGPAPVDTEFVDELARRWTGGDLLADEWYHRDEHSIEFQAVCLRWLMGRKPFRIVPVLVSSMHEHVLKKTDPLADPVVTGFVAALRKTMQGRKVCLVGGVDLAHVGAKFGDEGPLTGDLLKKIEDEDRASLARAAAVDAAGFFRSISDVGDWRRICGLSAITTLLAATDASRGSLVRYDRFADIENRELVSYAAMTFQ
ncbi:MAG: AmmeMemoRadiSam system protein B [Candidatus Brocadiae bacterium]|nr:AmmeMemoRadiSam system protein B [Candidatus Brocadiia bacterium]